MSHPAKIRSKTEHENALEEIKLLITNHPALGSKASERLALLTEIVSEYEDVMFPVGLPTPIEAIKFRMEQLQLVQRDLVPFIGSPSKVSEVLAGKRPLSKSMIRALHRGLKIPTSVLLQEAEANSEGDSKDFEYNGSKLPLHAMAKRN